MKQKTRKNPNYKYRIFTIFPDSKEFSYRRLESILDIVYEKLKLKLPEVLKFNDIPIILINQDNTNFWYNQPRNQILFPSKTASDNFDKYDSAKALLHEIGHYIWYRKLSEGQRNLWKDYFNNTLKEVKIDTILKIIKKYSEKEIRLKYPLLYRNIESLYTSKGIPNEINVFDYDQLLKWKNLGGAWKEKTIFSKRPISWYIADTSKYIPIEAFAEIFSYYLFYGEKYILTDNVEVFKSILFK